jgi:hypothetical protein
VWHERDLVKPAPDSPFAQYRIGAKDGIIRVYADQQGARAVVRVRVRVRWSVCSLLTAQLEWTCSP